MSQYTWNVFASGADLPKRLETDYLLTEGEEIELDGGTWLVERVEPSDGPNAEVRQAYVVLPHESAPLG